MFLASSPVLYSLSPLECLCSLSSLTSKSAFLVGMSMSGDPDPFLSLHLIYFPSCYSLGVSSSAPLLTHYALFAFSFPCVLPPHFCLPLVAQATLKMPIQLLSLGSPCNSSLYSPCQVDLPCPLHVAIGKKNWCSYDQLYEKASPSLA